MAERFAPVEGYDKYLVSSLGYVLGKRYNNRLLAKDNSVLLYRGGKAKRHMVGRLVADGFKVPPMHTFDWVLAKDGNPDNCRLENLYRGTAADMVLTLVGVGKHHYANRTRCGKGHAYTKENTKQLVRSDGRKERVCLTCRRKYAREYAKRKRDERKVGAA